VPSSSDRFLPYSRQQVSSEDIQSVVAVLESDFLTQGSCVQTFEEALADYVGAKYAVACATGTAALHLSCLALGIGTGDKLLTSPITFVASANCAQYVGADTVFSEIDERTWCLSPEILDEYLRKNLVSVVVPVHFAGHPVDLPSLYALKEKYGFMMIEDACHALGSEIGIDRIGSSKLSDMSVFSFHPVKHITMGEGGAITTNNKSLYKKLITYRTHGIHKNTDSFINHQLAFERDGETNPWYYEMSNLGYNYRITDIQCALGISQLKKIETFVCRRRAIAGRYNEAFRKIAVANCPTELPGVKHSYHLYTLQIDFSELGKSRNQVMRELRDNNIGSQVLYIPVHLQPYYAKKYGYRVGDFPISEAYYDRCLSIPLFPDMTDVEVGRVIQGVKSVLG
jgi:UDP-4-amino-4,6-dideoxy-N-acetyl-beta-L-altrosamine transaminase